MTTAAAVIACVVLFALAVLQVLVACGLPYGRFVWGGRHRVLPRRLRIGSAVSVVLYIAFGALMLSRAGILPGGQTGFVMVMTWILFAYFVVGIALNLISRSPAERLTMAPACAVLAVCTLVVALGPAAAPAPDATPTTPAPATTGPRTPSPRPPRPPDRRLRPSRR